jgi:hypothetical protein
LNLHSLLDTYLRNDQTRRSCSMRQNLASMVLALGSHKTYDPGSCSSGREEGKSNRWQCGLPDRSCSSTYQLCTLAPCGLSIRNYSSS